MAEQDEIKLPPIKTWSGLATVISVVAGIITAINVSVNWFDANIQKVSNTNAQLEQLRKEYKADIDKLKEDDKKRDVENQRRDAWALVNQLEIKKMVIQFRINECQIKSDERKPTAMEKQICDQYRQEKDEANNRFKEAWGDAMRIGKDSANTPKVLP